METIKSSNIFYISNFNIIGGVETYIYELAKKYGQYDITVVYKSGYQEQIQRLKKLVRVIHYEGQFFKCKKAFFNYETDIIDHIEADEYIQLIHAMFKTQCNLTPRIDPRINTYLCVSESAGKEWEELTGIKPILCRNPLMITTIERKPILYLISATRLTVEKGKNRMIKLAEALDKEGIDYLWLIFTNDTMKIDNPNVVYMKPKLNIRPYINSIVGKGYGVQLSDCEGDCYFTRECEALGLPLIVTPIPSFKEQGLEEGKNCYYMPFDMKNLNINRLYNIPTYEPFQKEDSWHKILFKKKSSYKEELEMRYEIEATDKYVRDNVYDGELSSIKCIEFYPPKGFKWVVSAERKDVLVSKGFAKVVREIKEQPVEVAIEKPKKETTARKTRKKTK